MPRLMVWIILILSLLWLFLTSIHIIISLAATYCWPLYQLDVKNAFLHGDLQEEVYMEQPPGFIAKGEYGKVCKLKKSLYELKQSPRAVQ